MEALSDAAYRKYSQLINNSLGINLGETRKEILESKLKKLMLKDGISSYENYFNILVNSKNKATRKDFTNEITVNKTDFFRENSHFNFIKQNPQLITEKTIEF